jgi:hypothetical protein
LRRKITVVELKRVVVLASVQMRSSSTSKWLRPAVGLIAAYASQALLSLAQAKAQRYADTVALFAALGGGW